MAFAAYDLLDLTREKERDTFDFSLVRLSNSFDIGILNTSKENVGRSSISLIKNSQESSWMFFGMVVPFGSR